jgi:pSer/pThr/pTyr-binding forkhead associated (FHA) protein
VDVSLCADPAVAATAPVQEPLRTFPLDLPELLIGRTDERRGIHPEILPNDTGISRRHAQFIRQHDGSFVLVDLNSTNGTILNGRSLEPGVPAPLTDGDVITIGQWTRLTIQGFQA